jgi:hypothetical protein
MKKKKMESLALTPTDNGDGNKVIPLFNILNT